PVGRGDGPWLRLARHRHARIAAGGEPICANSRRAAGPSDLVPGGDRAAAGLYQPGQLSGIGKTRVSKRVRAISDVSLHKSARAKPAVLSHPIDMNLSGNTIVVTG